MEPELRGLAAKAILGLIICATLPVASLAADQANAGLATGAAGIRRPLGPDELPTMLPGRWKVTLCIASDPSHAWIRYENVETHEVRTASRFSVLVGGWFDKRHLRWNYGLTTKAGVYMDREQSLEQGVTAGKFTLLTTYADNPKIYRGQNDGYGHGLKTNNCVTYSRDVWFQYTGEFYPLPEGYHGPSVFRNCILHYHPQLIGRAESPVDHPELFVEPRHANDSSSLSRDGGNGPLETVARQR